MRAMFAIVRDNVVMNVIPKDTSFELDGVLYPANWLAHATEADRRSIGIVPLVRDSHPTDGIYDYREEPPVFDGAVARITYAAVPMDIEVLKAREIEKVARKAYELLGPSDWMVSRAFEVASKPVPARWTDYRAAVRAEASRLKTAINEARRVSTLIGVVKSAVWPVPPQG